MLKYITSNKEKIDTAKRNLSLFGIDFKSEQIDLIEIQSESIEEIAKIKAEQAYAILKTPLFITDHGWSVPALNGFPGAYMKYMNSWLTSEDFLNLMKPHADKTIIKQEVLCYIDDSGCKTFSADYKGTFINEIRGEGLSAMRVVSMLPSGKSVAECIQENVNSFENGTLWKEFADMYNSRPNR